MSWSHKKGSGYVLNGLIKGGYVSWCHKRNEWLGLTKRGCGYVFTVTRKGF